MAQISELIDSVIERIEPAYLSINFTQPIAHGSFGEAFQGTYKTTKVAVKRIKSKHGKRPDKLIMREASIHQTLSHPNIVQFIGTHLDEDNVYIVTELIEGSNLEDIIYTRKCRVDAAQKVKIAVDILGAVSYLHQHVPQILHQDIKPANILISDTDRTAKLCDLGLAKVRSFDVASTTSGMHAAGTPEYMAPERMLHHRKATAASDVWSVAITLSELFHETDAWDLQNQDEEPILFIRQSMERSEIPRVIQKYPVLLPCVDYEASCRPTASELLRLFSCPACSKTIL